MRIIFCGTPDFSVAFLKHLAQSNHSLLAVATQPDRPAGRGRHLQPPPVKTAALELGLPILQPESVKDPDFAAQLQAFNADLLVVVAYSLLPKSVLAATRLGAVNVHGSLLPKYRGAAPVQWAIANGESHTGVTVFRLDEKMDHGPVLCRRTIPIGQLDTAPEVLARMATEGCTALDEALLALQRGDEPLPQDHSASSPAPKLKKEDGRIDWSWPAQTIHNRIRAFSPWPGGYSWINGKLVMIRRTDLMSNAPAVAPGNLAIANGQVFVGTGQGSLCLLELQAEGRKALPAMEFIRGLQTQSDIKFSEPPVQ